MKKKFLHACAHGETIRSVGCKIHVGRTSSQVAPNSQSSGATRKAKNRTEREGEAAASNDFRGPTRGGDPASILVQLNINGMRGGGEEKKRLKTSKASSE